MPETEPPASRQFIDLAKLEGAFDFDHGFSRPDWNSIHRFIESNVEPSDRIAAWNEAVHQWLEQLKKDLGGGYEISSSEGFLLLSAVDTRRRQNLLAFAERARRIICENLRDVAWDHGGKEVILIFAEEDDYYGYIAHFYRAEEIPRSLGVNIRTGYAHVALTYRSEPEACHTIAHELTHGSVAHLPLPLSADEGVCETLRRLIGGPQPRAEEGASSAYWTVVSGWRPPLMWDELAERHHAFWTEKNIQSFWAGTSWNHGQEASELSYSLAEVMVHLMSGDHEGFLAFLARAHYDDAGQTAALESLDMNLGDVAANFLGEGNWRPYRKAMVECWNAERTRCG